MSISFLAGAARSSCRLLTTVTPSGVRFAGTRRGGLSAASPRHIHNSGQRWFPHICQNIRFYKWNARRVSVRNNATVGTIMRLTDQSRAALEGLKQSTPDSASSRELGSVYWTALSQGIAECVHAKSDLSAFLSSERDFVDFGLVRRLSALRRYPE